MTKKVYLIGFSVFLMATGYFLAIPLFTAFADERGFGISKGALLVGLFVLAHKGGGLVFAPLADRCGHKSMAITGEALRGGGLLCIASIDQFPMLIIFSFLSGLGGGMSSPALNALIMFSVPLKHRLQVSSLRSIANNSGTLVGPIIAAWIMFWGDLSLSFFIAGCLYLIASASLLVLKDNYIQAEQNKTPLYAQVLGNRPFLLILFFLFGFWVLYAQLFVSIPNQLNYITEHIESIFLLNGVIGILFQYPVSKFIIARKGLMHSYATGVIFFVLTFLVIAMFPGWIGIHLAVILMAVGEMFILPTTDLLITNVSGEKNAASYFAFKNLADAIGRPTGGMIGGLLFGHVFPDGNSIGWMVFVLFAAALLVYHRYCLARNLQKSSDILKVS
ncbi:MFS transporter [Bacillus sp. T33-2]|uniref:MFS transporter n=1 Tax=Bacillus sp. T33-2 TaxID=2054168 RepID=UPI000C76D041|nr:MFS transporter [Bacillus sp. T33-2]PLR91599.1 hypothetical protein CVD19_21700 [Bacillus sp. T33-2]